MTKNELVSARAALFAEMNDFLSEHQNESGFLSAEDDATYKAMEDKYNQYSAAIDREERNEARAAALNQATSTPIVNTPAHVTVTDNKAGRASEAYSNAFWGMFRNRSGITPEMRNTLNEGTNSEGGYLVPDEFERRLVQGLSEAGAIRAHARVIRTSNGLHKIPVVASHGTAAWMDEGDAYTASDEAFGQVQLDAHKVGTTIKVSEELLSDSAFDLQSYIYAEFVRRIGDKEEDGFLNGDGSAKPTGILDGTAGGTVGVTAAKVADISADELVDLYYALKAPYRKNAVWILNDSTIKLIRKLKTGDGQYLWQPGIKDGEVNTILGRPYFTSPYMPEATAGNKAIIFGDLSYYWIGDRQGVVFKRLNELYAGNGQVGFVASKRLDGKVVLPEAIQILQMHA